MKNLGKVKPGSTIEVFFDTFDGGVGASITMTGLAVGDIKIYKNSSMTERASTSGFALLDTDGIDIDTITGIHGFSIDLADNTTAGFYTAGDRYHIVIDNVTIDGQTVSFVAARFEIGYEGSILDTTIATLSSQTSFTLSAGSGDDDAYIGCPVIVHDVASAVQTAQGYISDYTGSTLTVTLASDPGIFTMAAGDNISVFRRADGAITNYDPPTHDELVALFQLALRSDAGIGTDRASTLSLINADEGSGAGDYDQEDDAQEAIRDRGDAAWTTGAGSGLTPLASGTAQGGTSSTIQLAAGETFADDELNGNVVKITSGTGAGQSRIITDYTGASDTAAIAPNWITTPDATSVYEVVEGPADTVLIEGTDATDQLASALSTYDPPTHDELVGLIQLLVRSDAAIASDRAAELALINANEGSGAGSYDNTTDALQALIAEIFTYVIETGYPFEEVIRIVAAVLFGESNGGGSGTINFRDLLDTKDRVTATVDASNNRTTVTLDGS